MHPLPDMIQVLVHHHVEDYNRFKPVFDHNRATRKEAGALYERLSCSEHDPNDLYLFFEWDSTERARKYMGSFDTLERMREAGVLGKPEITYFKEIETRLLRDSSQAA